MKAISINPKILNRQYKFALFSYKISKFLKLPWWFPFWPFHDLTWRLRLKGIEMEQIRHKII